MQQPHYPISEPFGLTLYESCKDRPNKHTISFSPLLSIQRYLTVQEVICKFAKKFSVSTVAEFGSSTYTFFLHHLLECPFIDTVHQIDIDEDKIYSSMHVISLPIHRKFRVIKGRKPLTVNIFKGNVAEKDDRVLHSDVVIGIELIEHLYPADFEKFPETIFGFMKPKLVVLTTPNYDFNVLFENDGAFRDADHKFEFTRQEFRDWADKIICKYPDYQVQLYGIGEPPEGCSLDVGFGSQIAIFEQIQSSELQTTESFNNYTLIGSYDYFVFEKPRSVVDDIIDAVAEVRTKFGSDDSHTKKIITDDCSIHPKLTLPLEFVLQHCKPCQDMETLVFALSDYPLRYPLVYDNDVPYLEISDECDCNNYDYAEEYT